MRASDQGFERRLHTTTVDEQRLAVLDPQWGAAHPPPWPKLGKGTGPEGQICEQIEVQPKPLRKKEASLGPHREAH